MAIQQRQTKTGKLPVEYAKIPDGHRATVNRWGNSTTITSPGVVDHSLGMVTLVRGKPLAVTPAIDAAIVQNTMGGHSQKLYVSEHGQMHGAWLSVPGGSCIEFDKGIYLMQEDYDEYAFPIASK